MVVLIISSMLLNSIPINHKWFAAKSCTWKNKCSPLNEDQVRWTHKTMCLQVLLCLCSRCTIRNHFRCGVARRHNAIIMFGNKVQPSRQLLLTSTEIQMLLNLHLKPFSPSLRALSSYISTTALHSRYDQGMHFLYCWIIAKNRSHSTNVVVHPRHVWCQMLAFCLSGFWCCLFNTPVFVKMLQIYACSMQPSWGWTNFLTQHIIWYYYTLT